MDVKQVPPSNAARVTSGTEARNDEREQARLLRGRKQKKMSDLPAENPDSTNTQPTETSPDPGASQLIDSTKLIELLSQNPKAVSQEKVTIFRRSQFQKAMPPSISDGKKLNKQY